MFEKLDDPKRQALLALAAGLLSPVRSKGWSGFGEALGQGIQGGLLGFNQAQRTKEATDGGAMERRLQQMRLDEFNRSQKAREYMGQGLSKFLQAGTPAVPFNDALGDGSGGMIPGQDPSLDRSGLAGYLAKNPDTADRALEFLPKPQAPISVKPGDILLDPRTRQPIYTAPKEAPKAATIPSTRAHLIMNPHTCGE